MRFTLLCEKSKEAQCQEMVGVAWRSRGHVEIVWPVRALPWGKWSVVWTVTQAEEEKATQAEGTAWLEALMCQSGMSWGGRALGFTGLKQGGGAVRAGAWPALAGMWHRAALPLPVPSIAEVEWQLLELISTLYVWRFFFFSSSSHFRAAIGVKPHLLPEVVIKSSQSHFLF